MAYSITGEDPSIPLKRIGLRSNRGVLRERLALYESKGRKFESYRAHHIGQ